MKSVFTILNCLVLYSSDGSERDAESTDDWNTNDGPRVQHGQPTYSNGSTATTKGKICIWKLKKRLIHRYMVESSFCIPPNVYDYDWFHEYNKWQ
jgi:hypothetical protein